jgi:CcmD family protein
MKVYMNKKLILFIFSMVAFYSQAQEAPQMADVMRDNGKINVVITVIAIIFLAIVSFLIYLERKVSRLEKEIKNKPHS